LKSNVPFPFRAEWSGGSRQVIHHKFIVMDFNYLNPAVLTGSSKLAAGGEKSNGDNPGQGLLFDPQPHLAVHSKPVVV